MVAVELAPEFGYVIGVFVLSIFLNMYLGFSVSLFHDRVGGARKKYNVPYPTMYSDKSPEFNCYQRAHQNFHENWSMFLFMMFIVGAFYPIFAAVCGLIFFAGMTHLEASFLASGVVGHARVKKGRVAYAWGYWTGDPAKRMRGGFAYFGMLGLLIALFKIAGYDLWTHAR